MGEPLPKTINVVAIVPFHRRVLGLKVANLGLKTLLVGSENNVDGPMFQVDSIPILKAMVQIFDITLLQKKDFASFTKRLQDFYAVFQGQEQLALSIIVLGKDSARALRSSHFGMTMQNEDGHC